MKLTQITEIDERLGALEQAVKPFSLRAAKHDKEKSFPVQNIKDLIGIGYTALSVPRTYGGRGMSLYELVRAQEIIGKHDGSTALSIGWHMGITKHLGENNIWDQDTYREFANEVLHSGALINNAATEPATGSPTRGGKPETTAAEAGGKWRINGRKTFTTLSPVLTHFVVSAGIKGTDKTANFLVKRENKGLNIEETWDSVAMRATGSHDIVLKDAVVGKSDLVQELQPGNKGAQGWLLHIPACYLGIARAAQEHAVQFAATYSPNSIDGTISELPNVKQKIGEMELKIVQSQHFLYSVARQWDDISTSEQESMKALLGAVKHSVVNQSMEVVDLAMRIEGARSLSEQNPQQRYYRDVRAGLHNPPMDDMTIMQLAQEAITKLTT
ncbi:acyl-CoA dehydrogenase family protein [Thalassobacillus sp. C254]|uniref:acyl-CoA dehydrogenase family protein n=1 Tax=Thalassobacillus sp. C254 TaxID=1225341 RepID=UPI0006D1A82D|nr:acyl-CoA dehydrogenase family protein [Thalassobacillus sp. C254]